MHCCENLENWMAKMLDQSFFIGSGEIGGHITIEKERIYFDDGWNFFPDLVFNYCPFCGAKQIYAKL